MQGISDAKASSAPEGLTNKLELNPLDKKILNPFVSKQWQYYSRLQYPQSESTVHNHYQVINIHNENVVL